LRARAGHSRCSRSCPTWRRPRSHRTKATTRRSRRPMPRTLACPASLKGVLSAREAAAALASGLRKWSDVDELPVADGGEGTLDVLQAALGAAWRDADVHDAFGGARRARWL